MGSGNDTTVVEARLASPGARRDARGPDGTTGRPGAAPGRRRSPYVAFRAREGCTRFGSPGIFGKFGG
jgi:hypothetical protein